MMEVLAVFQNRTQALNFSRNLSRYNVTTKIINTPSELSTSCGLTVVFKYENFAKGVHCFRSGKYFSFVGFYGKKTVGGRITYTNLKYNMPT